MLAFAKRLMRLVALVLELPPDFFTKHMDKCAPDRPVVFEEVWKLVNLFL